VKELARLGSLLRADRPERGAVFHREVERPAYSNGDTGWFLAHASMVQDPPAGRKSSEQKDVLGFWL
jgi:hypothetical protein